MILAITVPRPTMLARKLREIDETYLRRHLSSVVSGKPGVWPFREDWFMKEPLSLSLCPSVSPSLSPSECSRERKTHSSNDLSLSSSLPLIY